jgi:hypothetical protein
VNTGANRERGCADAYASYGSQGFRERICARNGRAPFCAGKVEAPTRR